MAGKSISFRESMELAAERAATKRLTEEPEPVGDNPYAEFIISPTLGLKVNVPANAHSMFEYDPGGGLKSHCADGSKNFDLTDEQGTVTKSRGYQPWGKGVVVQDVEVFYLDEDFLDGPKRLS